MHIHDLDTPTLIADLDVLEKNIQDMATRCQNLEIPLRVHTKTHKVPEISKCNSPLVHKGLPVKS